MIEAVFLGRDGQQLGPYTRTNLMAMASRGEIRDGDMAWHEGLEHWQPAPSVLDKLGIRRMAAPPPVPTPPPAPKPEVRYPGGRRPDGSVHRLGDPEPEELAQSGDGGQAPAWVQGQKLQEELYRAFIGPEGSARYLPLFERFDAGESNLSWNWAGAFITSLWMLYRGMYLWGLLLWPLLAGLVGAGMGFMFAVLHLGKPGVVLSALVGIAIGGLYADKVYHGHARKMIERSSRMGLSFDKRREWLMRKGGTSFVAPLILLGFNLVSLSILAAIAVPAYHSYMARAQVMEGELLAKQMRLVVSQYYGMRHTLPQDNATIGLPPAEQLHGNFVSSVEVRDGTILVTYGGKSPQDLAGQVLAYVPEDAGGKLQWNCHTDATTVPVKFRPVECRE